MSGGENKPRSVFISSLSQVKPPALAPSTLTTATRIRTTAWVVHHCSSAFSSSPRPSIHFVYWHFPCHNESPFNWYLDNICDLPTRPLSPKEFSVVSAEFYCSACRKHMHCSSQSLTSTANLQALPGLRGEQTLHSTG